jgi:branched-chain amino acid transport system substrate-binding protein
MPLRKSLSGCAAATAAAVCLAMPAHADEGLKIGFVSTFTGASGVLGRHMYDGFMLGVDHSGGKLGGMPTQVLQRDDQFAPDVGVRVARELVEQDNVNFIVGFVFSSVLNAASRVAFDAKTFLISGTAGPKELAGSGCSPWFFSAAPENDMSDEVAGEYATRAGYKRVSLVAPNYVAGRDALGSFKMFYKGEIVDETYTPLDQVDYATEIAQMRSTKPDAAYLFMPGGFGINFIRQFYQAGLRSEIHVISKATSDPTTIPAEGEAALGSTEVTHWGINLDNAANKRFVADFVGKYHYAPSSYAVNSYDAALLIDSAMRAVKGNVADKSGIRKALEQAAIQSPRGPFKFNVNHYPIHNVYRMEVAKDADGKLASLARETLAEGRADRFAKECHMQ